MATYDFGYTWVWTHGHLVPFALFAVLSALALWRKWPRWLAIVSGMVAAWALSGFVVTQVILDASRPLALPTGAFLSSGAGHVLDVGAGSGRSTLMVLLNRPLARVTALDIYQGYFGIDDNTPARIRANARMAGVDDRLEVETGDMRAMPMDDGVYDAAVSAFAIDHLGDKDAARALTEVSRVLRPGGEFLLMIINVDGWVRFAYPLPNPHGGYFHVAQNADRWRTALEAAGFEVIEQGRRPATLFFLGRKIAPPVHTAQR